MAGTPWRRRPLIDWPGALLSVFVDLALLAVLATPLALAVTGLVQLSHRADADVPALGYGAVWALVYAAGLV